MYKLAECGRITFKRRNVIEWLSLLLDSVDSLILFITDAQLLNTKRKSFRQISA